MPAARTELIEPEEDLYVFNAEYPLPSHAAQPNSDLPYNR